MEDSFQTFSALIQEMTSKFLNVNGTWINLFFWEGQGLAASARNWTFLMFLYRAPRCMPQLQFVLAHTSSRQPNCHWTSDSKGLRIENEHPNPGFVRMQILKSWHWTLGPQGRSYSEDIAWQFTHLFAPFLQGSRTEVPMRWFLQPPDWWRLLTAVARYAVSRGFSSGELLHETLLPIHFFAQHSSKMFKTSHVFTLLARIISASAQSLWFS